MTEAEWLACGNPRPMLNYLMGKASDRKLRMFACGCAARTVQYITTHLSYRTCVERVIGVCERFADRVASGKELEAARRDAEHALGDNGWVYQAGAAIRSAVEAATITAGVGFARDAARFAAAAAGHGLAYSARKEVSENSTAEWMAASKKGEAVGAAAESQEQVKLVYDIFGNPFRPVTVDPNWRTDTAMLLAQQMYELRDFSAMPILADALQDAGCDNDDVLNHCRGSGPHVRGCWVVDLVLGKS